MKIERDFQAEYNALLIAADDNPLDAERLARRVQKLVEPGGIKRNLPTEYDLAIVALSEEPRNRSSLLAQMDEIATEVAEDIDKARSVHDCETQ